MVDRNTCLVDKLIDYGLCQKGLRQEFVREYLRNGGVYLLKNSDGNYINTDPKRSSQSHITLEQVEKINAKLFEYRMYLSKGEKLTELKILYRQEWSSADPSLEGAHVEDKRDVLAPRDQKIEVYMDVASDNFRVWYIEISDLIKSQRKGGAHHD